MLLLAFYLHCINFSLYIMNNSTFNWFGIRTYLEQPNITLLSEITAVSGKLFCSCFSHSLYNVKKQRINKITYKGVDSVSP